MQDHRHRSCENPGVRTLAKLYCEGPQRIGVGKRLNCVTRARYRPNHVTHSSYNFDFSRQCVSLDRLVHYVIFTGYVKDDGYRDKAEWTRCADLAITLNCGVDVYQPIFSNEYDYYWEVSSEICSVQFSSVTMFYVSRSLLTEEL